MEHKTNIVGVALLCVAFGSEALTLGRVRGVALVGQPLDVVVPVQMDAAEDASSLCFDADVFHADTRQEASRVRVVVDATAQPHTANVRILSSAVVDEPVVTVYLRTGCGQKTTRRYVLLADMPSEVAAAAPYVAPVSALPPAQGGLIPVAPVSASVSSAASNSAPVVKAKTVPVSTPTVRQGVANKRPQGPAVVASPGMAPSDEKSRAGRSPGQPRLKLDSLELLPDRVATLASSTPVPAPEDALRDVQRMQTLEGDVKALLALAAKNEASLVDLKARLQKAETERFPGGLVYGLIALVLACLAALTFLWNRQRRVHAGDADWWRGAIVTPASAPPEPGPSPAPGARRMEMSEVDFDDLLPSGAADGANHKRPSSPPPAVAPQLGPKRSLNSEVMLDIRQQAEFFISLGQTDRAVRILKKQIDESAEPNPFVYLDLLSLFHSLSLKTDFQLFREDFNRLFNGLVPEFAFFKDEGKGLESYPDVLSRITALWPTPKVLALIEAFIAQDPGAAKSQSFDLAAFRDLLLLHAIAQSVVLLPRAEINGQPDLSMNEMPLPRLLDLDLTDSNMEGLASSSVAATDVDARRALDIGNLMEFDLPVAPKPPGPVGNKPGPQADRP